MKGMCVAILTVIFSCGLAMVAGASSNRNQGMWPSVQDQLVAECIDPASPLADMVRDNQEFWMLRPKEMHDTLRVPPWLRVIWRKAHPEGNYSGDDPTGGYPLVLKEVAQWMLSHQDLTPSPATPDTPPGLASPFTETAQQPDWMAPPDAATPGTNVRNSGAQTSPRSESDIRINYWNPQQIIGASNAIVSGGTQAEFYSTDGGTTWGQTSLSLTGTDAFHSDPTVDWTSNGNAWSTTLGINNAGNRLYLRLYKSTNGGVTWTFDSTGSGSQNSVDKQQVWVDHSACSTYKDNLYSIWHNGNPAYMNTKPLAGTWGVPIQVSGAESTGTCIGSDVKTNAYGDVFGFWPTTGNSKILMVKSTNGGTGYGTPVQVTTTYDSYDIGVPSFNSRRILIYVTGGAYRTSTKNLVYAVWTDLTGATGCTAPANEPGSSTTSTCKTRIWFSRSTDGGTSWSTKAMLNNQSSPNDQYNPWLAVDETSGALGVMYYDTVADTGRLKTDVWFQSSYDDGATWSSAVKITTGMTDETAATANAGNQYGDYNGMSAYAGLFFPSWTDRRNNAKEEIWTAKVTDCVPPGQPPTPTFTNVLCDGLTVNWTAVTGATGYDVYRATGASCATAAKLNASTVTGTSYADSGLAATTQYSYYVVPKNATCARTDQCVCASVTTPACSGCTAPGAPTLTGATGGCTGVNLTWTAGTGTTNAYNVYRSANTTCPVGALTLLNATPLSAATLAYADTTAVAGTTYTYIVRGACDAGGATESVNSGCLAAARLAAPTAPAAPTFTLVACTSQTVNWSAVSGATSYDVWRATGASCTGAAKITATPVAGTSYADSGLTGSTPYSYFVTANNACGPSAEGTCASSTTAAPIPTTPAAPGVSDIDGCLLTGVFITWSPVSGATSYDLQVDGATLVTGVASPYTYLPGDSASHTCAIRAINACGASAFSTTTAGTDIALMPPSVGPLKIQKMGTDMLINWTQLAPALVDYYEVMRGTSVIGPFTTSVGTASGISSGILINLANEPTPAYYKVRAVKGTCFGTLD